ncbi:MAG: Unknown protein [uncultured Sulfurovum sp.]|uniref:BD-FAE-like domain-containing protein n=1 Tax=uncultured Sulfurovum sp. TaxID=269237 RepID=A0A6S6TBK7_9BACT|nr:MAG: Unknown protein [uncultured Sulfurovum sp.]
MRNFILIVFLFLTVTTHADNKKSLKILCFALNEEEANTSCSGFKEQTLIFSSHSSLADKLSQIQKEIRHQTQNHKVILKASGFTGTLLSIAQSNLLPYYRQNIRGLILEESPANLLDLCLLKKSKKNLAFCEEVNDFQKALEDLASKREMFIAYSPILQMDWYWSKTLIIGNKYKESWVQGFKDNSIEYMTKHKLKNENFLDYFPLKISHKIQPKSKKIKPDYYGPLLRFHLNKLYYKTDHNIRQKSNVAYGLDELQRYDVYFKKTKEKNHSNPMMIYVHGGGWNKGDKKAYQNFCKLYADRGFTTVSINYRLLKPPTVSMEEMVLDIRNAIKHVVANAKVYEGNAQKVVVIAESAGAQLAYVAISRLSNKKMISASFFSSMPSNFKLFSKKKQIQLSNIENDEKRITWLERYSPLKQLPVYKTPTFMVHSLNDAVVSSKHLESLEIQSVIHWNNISTLWVESAEHPVLPSNKSLQPSYLDIEFESMKFIHTMLIKSH